MTDESLHPPLRSVEPVGDMEDLRVRGLAGYLLGHCSCWLGWLSHSKEVVQDASPVRQREEDGSLQQGGTHKTLVLQNTTTSMS